MRKFKYFIMGITFFIMLPFLYISSNIDEVLNAESSTLSNVTFKLYDKVNIADRAYTVIGIGDTISLLDNVESTTTMTWDDAEAALPTYANNLGTLGAPFFVDKVSQPTSALLDNVKSTSDTTVLHANIPAATKYSWWLGDPSEHNRSKYLSKANSFNISQTVTTVYAEDGVCRTYNKREYGILPTRNLASKDKLFKEVTKVSFLMKRKNSTTSNVKFSEMIEYNSLKLYAYTSTSKYVYSIGGNSFVDPRKGTIYFDENGKVMNRYSSSGYDYELAMLDVFYLYDGGRYRNELYEEKQSYNNRDLLNKDYELFGLGEKLYNYEKINFGKNQSDAKSYNDFRNEYIDEEVLKAYGVPNVYEGYVSEFSKGTKLSGGLKTVATGGQNEVTCATRAETAGKAAYRPLLSIPLDKVYHGSTKKRVYTVSDQVNGSLPATSTSTTGRSFLTLISDDLSLEVVGGNTLYQKGLDENGKVTIPIHVTGLKEGTQYVTAKAVNTSGKEVYGVLSEVTGEDMEVSFDPTGLVKDDEFSITLYLEDSGSSNTAYISEGQEVKVYLKDKQTIAFTGDAVAESEYGSEFTSNATVTTELSAQADSDITFSIDGDNAEIVSQTPDRVNGSATATIKPNTGTGIVKVKINKAGNDTVANAPTMTQEVTLKKKSITVKPMKPERIYNQGEKMPTLDVEVEGLVNGDSIPEELRPILINLNEADVMPDVDGVIKQAGVWKLQFDDQLIDSLPASFTDKYDITFEDYRTDPSYIFETSISDIPDQWIVISSEPNEHGWYNSAVTITPSEAAISNGYDIIEVLNDNDEVIEKDKIITYNQSMIVTPKIRLRKGSAVSNVKTLDEIKLDTETPSASIEVINEDQWTALKKDVHVTITKETDSKIESVVMKRLDSEQVYTPTINNHVYSFEADQDGTYTITVTNFAGSTYIEEKTIAKIDTDTVDISAVLVDFPNPDVKISQDITITTNAGASGIQAINAYYKKNASDSFTLLRALDNPEATMTFTAEMNGIYQFEIVTNAGVKKTTTELTVEGLNPPLPCTKFNATYKNDTTKTYTSGTWTNDDIILDVSNTNSEIEEAGLTPVWETSKDGTAWEAWSGPKTFTTSETIQVRAKVEISGQTYYETTVKKFTVKLDQTLPDQPNIINGSQYVNSAWFKDSVSVESTYTKKTNGIKETLYVCDGTKSECEGASATWTVVLNNKALISENGQHQLYFKVVDEAGNESPFSEVAYVNINTKEPVITIKLNEDPLKKALNTLTFGYFFKDTIKVEAEVDFAPSGMTNADGFDGKTYIVIADTDSTMPEINDDWGSERTTVNIDEESKVKIYVKAVSDAGKVTRESTIYDVYMDQTKPEINASNMTEWSKKSELSFTVSDTLSGLDHSALTYMIGNTTSPYTVKNDVATIKNLADGTYIVDLYAKDLSGNELTKQVTVMIDASAPVFGAINANTAWVKERDIIVPVSDQYSGISSIAIRNSSGVSVPHTDNGDDTITFTVKSNDTYTISAKDAAGNMSTKTYVEANIDTTAPVISDITVENETILAKSKKVSFKVEDHESGVKAIAVTYREDGQEKTATVSGPDTNGIYSFTARVNGSYTIKAEDEVGMISTESVYVDQIDPSSIKLNVLTNINTWVKDEMKIEFNLELGASTLEAGYPIVKKGKDEITPVLNEGVYSFTASENDSYVIEVKSTDGELIDETLQIQKIDLLSPIIRDVSNNTTSSEYRGPISVSFHVYDYNDVDENTIGSGLKANYPAVYYMKDGDKQPCTVTQNQADTSKYSFTADQNVTYVVEAVDVVEHDLAQLEIPVDHIVDDSKLSDLQVVAENKGLTINSGDWVNGDITFTISGGLDTSILQKYQIAITNGTAPVEADWNDLNDSQNHKHKITDDITGKSYWFRTLPVINETYSEPFVVNLDNVAPTNVQIVKTKRNTNAASRFIHAVTFGNWMKESQDITFTAQDDHTDSDDIIFYYAEERRGVTGAWKQYQGNLSYDDTDITLHVKAVDLAGNETELIEALQIDTEAPVIDGVKNQKEYKQYYLPRFVTISDDISGVKQATYTKDGTPAGTFTEDVVEEIRGEGTYVITATDYADNEITLTFKIVKLPDINTQIDGSDESKEIIDQVKEEYEQIKNHIDQTEKDEYQNWVDQATSSWSDQRLVELEDKKTASKVEGTDDTSFDPKTELVVEEIEESKIPVLPNRANKIYALYLRKGNDFVQPNGSVKVYLPYSGKDQPIVYEIDKQGNIREISVIVSGNFITFTTNVLHTYAISSISQDLPDDETGSKDHICVIGPDGKADTSDDVCGKPNDKGDLPVVNPDGSITIPEGGSVVFPDGSEVELPDGGTIKPDGAVELPDGSVINPDGSKDNPDDNNGNNGSNTKPDPDDDNKPNAKPDYNVTPDKDSDDDGKPDINIDFDCDGKADINIDLNDDGIPDINIDTTGDGKPNYNIDLNGDGKADVNIGPVKWKAELCKATDCGKPYCTSSYYKPKLNVDADGDGLPDVNLDFNGDRIPELNIDINFDYIPDLDIDTTGDGKPNINIDVDGNGIADLNLLKMTNWTPNINGEKDGMKFDTMTGLQPVYNVDTSGDGKADSNIVDNSDNSYILSSKEEGGSPSQIITETKDATTQTTAGTTTGEGSSWSRWWIMFGISTVSLITSLYTNRRRKRKLQ